MTQSAAACPSTAGWCSALHIKVKDDTNDRICLMCSQCVTGHAIQILCQKASNVCFMGEKLFLRVKRYASCFYKNRFLKNGMFSCICSASLKIHHSLIQRLGAFGRRILWSHKIKWTPRGHRQLRDKNWFEIGALCDITDGRHFFLWKPNQL